MPILQYYMFPSALTAPKIADVAGYTMSSHRFYLHIPTFDYCVYLFSLLTGATILVKTVLSAELDFTCCDCTAMGCFCKTHIVIFQTCLCSYLVFTMCFAIYNFGAWPSDDIETH